jgi:predicted ATPase
MKLIKFRIQNYRNIEDSGWIPVERVTAFVGRNESGKTTLLKALHKFNPATPEPYKPQQEFPRDRYTRDFRVGGDWPISSLAFALDCAVAKDVAECTGGYVPDEAICTRYYDGSLKICFTPEIVDHSVESEPVIKGLKTFAHFARRLEAPAADQEEATQLLRVALADWATRWQDKLNDIADLRNAEGVNLLTTLRQESNSHSKPQTADMVEALQEAVNSVLEAARKPLASKQAEKIVEGNLPVFIYFENYGMLDSAIYLPRFLEDLKRVPHDPKIRTINAMFQHVNLTAAEIETLGQEEAVGVRSQGQQPSPEVIAKDQERKEARAIKLSSASNDISERFATWWSQRRHQIRYHADGSYFRIWVTDNKRPNVEIELEARSKGFQWFFSFYLVFLVESEDGHKNAILLLDEPGLNLHPTAQQELIGFFEQLSERNQLLYTTHSPFLIDGENIHRVRPVTEDDTGHSRISVDTWPSDRDTIFPLQAAAGYAMVRGLFRHKRNMLVEGMSDYYYLHALSQQCIRHKRNGLPDDIYITPCGGTKMVSNLASLFLGQEVRPLVLLDGDDAGHIRKQALLKELYIGHEDTILMLDTVLNRPGEEVEIEDILGEEILLPVIRECISSKIKLNAEDRKIGSLVTQIKHAAKRHNVELPDGWKASVALQLVAALKEGDITLPDDVLDRAGTLMNEIRNRFL